MLIFSNYKEVSDKYLISSKIYSRLFISPSGTHSTSRRYVDHNRQLCFVLFIYVSLRVGVGGGTVVIGCASWGGGMSGCGALRSSACFSLVPTGKATPNSSSSGSSRRWRRWRRRSTECSAKFESGSGSTNRTSHRGRAVIGLVFCSHAPIFQNKRLVGKYCGMRLTCRFQVIISRSAVILVQRRSKLIVNHCQMISPAVYWCWR